MNDYLAAVDNNPLGVLGFQMHHIEKCWTKADLVQDLNVAARQDILKSGQVMATIVIMQKNPGSLSFAQRWFEEAVKDNYHFVDDSASIIQNDSCFEEHRHDQSIFSLMIKQEKGVLFSDEIQYHSESRPFRATRKRI